MISCIYKITNKANGKFYIGSTHNFEERKYGHLAKLKQGKHPSRYLQRSFLKYGENIFEFEILEETKIDSLLIREQFYLDTLMPWNPELGYNTLRTAGTTLGYKHSEESKRKISRKGEAHPMFGKKHTEESLRKIRIKSTLGRKYDKDSDFVKNRSKRVLQFSKDGIFIKEWSSGKEAARALEIGNVHISNCCHEKRKSAYGFLWKFAS